MEASRALVWLVWSAFLFCCSSNNMHAQDRTILEDLKGAPLHEEQVEGMPFQDRTTVEDLKILQSQEEEEACKSARSIDEYLASQNLNLNPEQVKPLVSVFNSLSFYQIIRCKELEKEDQGTFGMSTENRASTRAVETGWCARTKPHPR